jgi:hypothetical protein
MLSDSLPRPASWPRLLTPVDARIAPLVCLLLLTAACALTSFAFACATPFAAFAAIAGAMLPLSAALPVVLAAWIVNQAIGFGVLGYPIELNTFLWGGYWGSGADRDRCVSPGATTLAGDRSTCGAGSCSPRRLRCL